MMAERSNLPNELSIRAASAGVHPRLIACAGKNTNGELNAILVKRFEIA